MEEQRRMPFSSRLLPGQRVTVFAPHADDETLGCGGTLLLHKAASCAIRVIVMTDGAAGGDPAVRRVEVAEACTRMGLEPPIFWNFPDRSLLDQVTAVAAAMAEELGAHPADLVYTTSPLELHPDHRGAAHAAWQTFGRMPLSQAPETLAYFEVGTPLQPNVLTDISAVFQAKSHAALAFTSQFHTIPYDEIALSLNVFRSLTLRDTGCTHAEAFLAFPASATRRRSLAERLHPAFGIIPFPAPFEPSTIPPAQPRSASRFDASVIVRTKNRPERLREAVQSILAQTHPPREVIIANDGGPLPAGILPATSGGSTVWREIMTRGSGRSVAWNAGAQAAISTWLLILDDDDLWFPDHVQTFAEAKAEGASFMYSDAVKSEWRMMPDGRWLQQRGATPFKGGPFSPERLYTQNFIPTCTWAIRRQMFLELGGINESIDLFEDWDFLLRLSEKTHFHYTAQTTSEYRWLTNRPIEPDWDAARLELHSHHPGRFTQETLTSIIQRLSGENDLLISP